MSATVSLPLWLFVPIALIAAWALLERALIPSVRWFFRRRLNRLIDTVNERLDIEIRPFQRTRRQVLIDRLAFDPKVVEVAQAQAREKRMPLDVAMQEVRRYAREIVPAFNAWIYFRIGYSLARSLARMLYRVRLGWSDPEALAAVPADATVVFVMNHRSNMDYILVAFLAADRTALSYAVGEWARVWGLQSLIRSMGAYFVRRNSENPVYRRVLERYVAMASEAGVAQAVFPEGGLTRDGRLRPPRLGILDYTLKAFDPKGARDVVFVPVGINYDRVLEDRTQLRPTDAKRTSGWAAARTALGFFGRQLMLMLNGRFYRFGYACVNFGEPLYTRRWLAEHAAASGGDLRFVDKDRRFAVVGELAEELMRRVGAVVPVLPVSLLSHVLLEADGPLDALELKGRALATMESLQASGAKVYLPRGDRDYAVDVGLRMLTLRNLVVESEDGLYSAVPQERLLLAYYANAIAHLFPDR